MRQTNSVIIARLIACNTANTCELEICVRKIFFVEEGQYWSEMYTSTHEVFAVNGFLSNGQHNRRFSDATTAMHFATEEIQIALGLQAA